MDPSEEIIDEYFEYLADRDVYRAPTVLSWLTDYIDTKNENAIYKLLQHNLASEAVAGLVDLLEFDDKRLTESVVHILGTIVEHPRCRQYVLEVPRNTATTGQNNPTLFTALVNMLMSEDKNVVMNAAGTIANIAESSDGRLWILQQAVFDDALPILGVLTVDPHQWAASNSALVLARLTLSQEGIVKILTHERSSYVLINLSSALCGHNPGSSMNAAFAVGRLLERGDARSKLLSMKNFKNTMTALTKMLYNKEAGPRKNACFAFSCLANSKEGHDRLLSNVNSELILDQLVRLITDPDDETAWFAAVTLRSVGSQKEGVFRLRDHKSVYTVLKKLVKGGGVKLKSDLLTEVKMTLDIISKLPKLPAPVMTTIDSFSVSARWESVIATPGNRVTYQLFQGCTCVYEGTKSSCTVKNLKPFTSYVFRIRAINNTDEGPYSGPALITTNEGVPGPPGEVNNEGKPQHNSIKISWTPPPNPNGTLTGYVIFADGKRVGVVGLDKLSYTVKDLPHSTSIPIQVAPVTAAGEGEKSVPIMCSTLNLSDYPPKKPILSTSGGANEINVSWIDPPKQLGPIDHYELVMNGEVIYSGKEQGFRVSNLEPLTNYTFNVRVVTADGYVIESEPAKKKAGSKVVQKNGNAVSGTESEGDLPDVEQARTPTPEITKSVSDTREIIRPKKKSDRFTTNKKQNSDENNKTSPRKPAPKDNNRRSLTTIDEVSSTVTLDTSPPASAAPKGVSEVVVKKSQVPPNTAESSLSSLQKSASSIVPGDKPDPRSLAAKSMSALLPKSKSVTFCDDVRVNTGETASLRNPGVSDSKSVYVPNVLTSRVKAFDPETAAEISDTAISLDNDNHKDSVEFLVDYVTSYEAKSEDGASVVTSPLKDECDVNAETSLSKYFASKTYNHALSNLEDSVNNGEETEITKPDITGTELLDSDGVTSESKSLDPDSKSVDTTSYTSFSSGSNQKIGITSLSSIASLDTESQSTSSLNASVSQDNALPSSVPKDTTSLHLKSHEAQHQSTHALNMPASNVDQQPPHYSGSGHEVNHLKSQDLSTLHPESENSSLKNLPQNQISNGQGSANITLHATHTLHEPSQNAASIGPEVDNATSGSTPASKLHGPNDHITENGSLQKAPSQFQLSLDSIPQYQSSQSHRLSNQPTQSPQNQQVQNQSVHKVVVDGHIPQVEISLENIPDAAKAHLALQRPGFYDASTAGRKTEGRNVPKERSRRRRHDSEELGPARSLNDILLIEPDSRKINGDEMIPDQNEALNYKHDYKSHRRRFNMDDEERNLGEGVEEQNKLITALIAQQNSDFEVQNKRTQQLINTVRNNIKNAIQSQSKRELLGPHRQLSSNKFISTMNAPKRSVKLSSVNMNMFGDMDSDFPLYQARPAVNPTQSKTSPLQGRRRQRRKKQQKQLPPVHRQGPATADIQFHFPKL